jgi:hypothetical protein
MRQATNADANPAVAELRSLAFIARRAGVSVPTAWRWARAHGRGGHKLRTIEFSGRVWTTERWYEEFRRATEPALVA